MGMCLSLPKCDLSGLKLPYMGWSRMMFQVSLSSDIQGAMILQASSGYKLGIEPEIAASPWLEKQ